MNEKTRLGTACSVCGKKIGKGRLAFYPYGTTCSGPCFITEAIRQSPLAQLELLNGGMSWNQMAGILEVTP